jgi:uncharacterized membrane protein
MTRWARHHLSITIIIIIIIIIIVMILVIIIITIVITASRAHLDDLDVVCDVARQLLARDHVEHPHRLPTHINTTRQ